MNQVIYEKTFSGGQTLQLVHGDLTTESVEAIVNAANRSLVHGGGVAGIILSKGGRVIQQESDAWVQQHGPVTHAEPAFTTAGRLPCRYVIHAVGPMWGEGNEDIKLQSAVSGSLLLAEKLGVTSLALPAISTGIFGFPKERAAGIILSTISNFLLTHPESSLHLLRLTIIDLPTLQAFQDAWQNLIK